jgi:hypothetical protein
LIAARGEKDGGWKISDALFDALFMDIVHPR